MTVKFTIIGNQENKKANPIPYHRATQGSKWNPAHRRYMEFKDYVASEFLKSADPFGGRMPGLRKPIGGTRRGSVTASISFGPETHADSDNVIKGILDALFENDKEIDVHTSHSCGHEQPKVEVAIEIEHQKYN